MNLKTEVSRIDCRMFDNENKLKHFFIITRININTAAISGITFKITKEIIDQVIKKLLVFGFHYIQYERDSRQVTYDMINRKFVSLLYNK